MQKWKKTCTILYSVLATLNLLGAIALTVGIFLYNSIQEPPKWANVPRPSEIANQFIEPAVEMFVISLICGVGIFLCRRGRTGIIVSLLIAFLLIILAVFDYVSAFRFGIEIEDQIKFVIDAGISLALIFFLLQRLNAVRSEVSPEQ